MRTSWCIAILLGAIIVCSPITAGPVIWANQADFGPHHLQSRDLTTGAVISDFSLPGNGRGVVQVGNVLYVTSADNNHVDKYDATTGALIGNAFNVAGASALSTIAYDGVNFWIGDYSGTNHAYKYTPGGTLLSTISLGNCGGFCDGLEYFNGKLISNRGDNNTPGIYDVYDLSGNLLTAALINTGNRSATGIAFDGTDFWVSSINPSKLLLHYNISGTLLGTVDVSATNTFGIEDLSFDYSTRPDTGVPEPSSWLLMSSGLAGLLVVARRKLA